MCVSVCVCVCVTIQAEYARLMEARDQLSADVSELQGTLADKDRDLQAVEASSDATSRSLAARLATAQAQAEEVNSQCKIAEMALSNEVRGLVSG